MNSPSQNQFRLVPTLTEIVQPGELLAQSKLAAPAPEDKVLPTLEQLDSLIAQRVREEIDALVRTLMADQLAALQQRLHEEFQALVQQAATQVPRSQNKHPEVN
jgi:BMFP domain-containing protein YqiC